MDWFELSALGRANSADERCRDLEMVRSAIDELIGPRPGPNYERTMLTIEALGPDHPESLAAVKHLEERENRPPETVEEQIERLNSAFRFLEQTLQHRSDQLDRYITRDG